MKKPVYDRIEAVLAGYSQTNNLLANELGMNRNTVSKWCRNKIQTGFKTLFQIANVLEIDVRELLVSTAIK